MYSVTHTLHSALKKKKTNLAICTPYSVCLINLPLTATQSPGSVDVTLERMKWDTTS